MFDSLLAEYEGQFGRGRNIQELVDWVEGIPPMPEVASRAMRLVDDPDATSEQLAELIARDPALASQILKVANSAALAQQQAVTNLNDAILVTGFSALKSIILAATLRSWNKKFGPLERLVWEKSIGTAIAARCGSARLRKSYRDELFMAGLLHNLGQIVLLSHDEIGPEYPGVLHRIRETQTDYATAEREIIGFSHPLVGALVARKWDFPTATCHMILHYDDPFEGIGSELDEKTALLKLAATVSLEAGIGFTEGHPTISDATKDVARILGLVDDLENITQETKEQFDAEASLYS